ncbi:hypothetical protein [Pyrococcus sp. ST04]|uniref:hypothetical protein n=1 Tax=Pyrococcus sp. ST04 TaxID=1183377 RepID=UPI0002605BF1|nr:hypothetical protein [Pyrococcus sp. ST04]AFK22925.1 hypothetical protein Py04_1351 [Pyrococcus sp. ST04]
MRKKVFLFVIIAIIIGGLFYPIYGYLKFDDEINPQKKTIEHSYVVIRYPDSRYLVLRDIEYVNLTAHGWSPPRGSRAYLIKIRGYITGIPEIDLAQVFLSKYDEFTIVVGSPEVSACSKNPSSFYGDCESRALAVSEITVVTSMLFKRYYYWEAIKKGLSNESAKEYAYKETMERKNIRYLSFLTKALIGLGKIGNRDHLCVVILGPAEGASSNQIIIPRPGLIILEGKRDEVLRAEAILIEKLLNVTISS